MFKINTFQAPKIKALSFGLFFSLMAASVNAGINPEANSIHNSPAVENDSAKKSGQLPGYSLKTHNIGLAAGEISGYGFTYRHWGQSKNGYQLTFIPVGKVSDNDGNFDASLGAMGLRSLHQTEFSNFFGYYGANYNFKYNGTRGSNYNGTNYEYYHISDFTHALNMGMGVGVEIQFWNLNLSLMGGYAGAFATNKKNDPNPFYSKIDPYTGVVPVNPTENKWKNSFEMKPSIEAAIFYSF